MEFTLVMLIIFVAFLVRATFGFGDALVAMPLLVLLIGIKTAAPLMALLAFVIAFLIYFKNRKSVRLKITLQLVISGLLGVPFGLYFLVNIDEKIINIILGAVLILFAIFKLFSLRFHLKTKTQNIFIYPVGFISGMLGAAYNTNGPPVIMLMSSRNWQANDFRSTLQAYFLFTGIGILAGHLAWGNITGTVLSYFLACLPVIVITFFIGEKWFRKLRNDKFYVWVYFVLLLLGVSLVLKELLF
ncbi:MAG: hypothetical protein B6D64_14290 [Bacteroidetes bacterium 4484_276]|nr:MAG: hypothetical protein B6D64_14290 [Bacteroidetes bacterium 4484_276]